MYRPHEFSVFKEAIYSIKQIRSVFTDIHHHTNVSHITSIHYVSVQSEHKTSGLPLIETDVHTKCLTNSSPRVPNGILPHNKYY